jgi:hypothetical protein
MPKWRRKNTPLFEATKFKTEIAYLWLGPKAATCLSQKGSLWLKKKRAQYSRTLKRVNYPRERKKKKKKKKKKKRENFWGADSITPRTRDISRLGPTVGCEATSPSAVPDAHWHRSAAVVACATED